MINTPRNLLWMLPLLFLLTSPLWKPPLTAFLAPRGGYNPKLAQPEEETPVQNFIMDSVAITLTSQGRPEWQIDADQAFTGEQGDDIQMAGVKAKYIGVDKEPTHITSNKGQYFIDQRHLVLTDRVVLTKPTKDQQLLSEQLDYYDGTKKMVSPGRVELRSPKIRLTAGRMDYDLETGGYDFTNRVKVTL